MSDDGCVTRTDGTDAKQTRHNRCYVKEGSSLLLKRLLADTCPLAAMVAPCAVPRDEIPTIGKETDPVAQ